MYNIRAKTWLEKGEKFILSSGRTELLERIEEEGSLRKAAQAMGMSYRHAWGIVRKISTDLGIPVIDSTRGGKTGGASTLTSTGREIIQKYRFLDEQIQSISRYGAKPSITVDGVVLVENRIVLIIRKNPPFQGHYALPGGFVDYGETTEAAVVRELHEEISVQTEIIKLLGVYSEPDRDPRGHTISVVYNCRIIDGTLKASDDAAEIGIFDLDELPPLAFDHSTIIADFRAQHTH